MPIHTIQMNPLLERIKTLHKEKTKHLDLENDPKPYKYRRKLYQGPATGEVFDEIGSELEKTAQGERTLQFFYVSFIF